MLLVTSRKLGMTLILLVIVMTLSELAVEGINHLQARIIADEQLGSQSLVVVYRAHSSGESKLHS
jgi:hypothetical protein